MRTKLLFSRVIAYIIFIVFILMPASAANVVFAVMAMKFIADVILVWEESLFLSLLIAMSVIVNVVFIGLNADKIICVIDKYIWNKFKLVNKGVKQCV